MATQTLKFKKGVFDKILNGLKKPLKSSVMRNYWTALIGNIDTQTQRTFRGMGARDGMPRWQALALSTIRTPKGKPKMRISSGGDFKVKSGGRYSNIMQVSGKFRKSFKKIQIRSDRAIFGTKYRSKIGVTAEDIMNNPRRNVLFVTDKEITEYGKMFLIFYMKNFKV